MKVLERFLLYAFTLVIGLWNAKFGAFLIVFLINLEFTDLTNYVHSSKSHCQGCTRLTRRVQETERIVGQWNEAKHMEEMKQWEDETRKCLASRIKELIVRVEAVEVAQGMLVESERESKAWEALEVGFWDAVEDDME